MKSQEVFKEFFEEDGYIINGKKRMSVFLAIKRDLQFCLGVPSKYRSLSLSGMQKSKLRKMLPTFATISLFCSSVDLLSRVLKKRRPKNFENKKFFTDCLVDWFELDEGSSEELWKLRNSVSHQYALNSKHVARRFGSRSIIEKTPKGFWIFYLNSMYSSLVRAKRKIYKHIKKQNEEERKKTAQYLLNNGFFYIPIPKPYRAGF